MPVRRRRARKPSRSNRSQAAQDRGLAILQQALGVCTWVWDVRRDRVTWYGDLSPLLGLPAGAFSGRFADYLAHVHPEDRERAREIYVACLRGDCDQYRNEERIVLPDGSVRWLETFGRARRSARGRTIEMSGVVLDCSARKALEARAARIEQRHTAILEAMQTPLIVSRRRDGVVVAVNRAWERERGVPRERVLGRPGAAIGHWCDLSERERIVRAVDEHGAVSEVPVRIRRADGTVRDVRVSCVAVELDGEPHLVWSPRDVTAELAAERKFATLFATSPVAIALATADGRHLEVNDAWERMTGIARERALGASAAELGIWAEPAERLEALARLQADGALANFAARFRRADGALLDALVWAAPLELGSERCVLWVWSDVTEQQVQQRLLVEVARAVSPASAGAFLEELVARLAAELRADAVFVGELVGPANDRVRALAVWRDGARGAPFDIPLAGSACESVIEHADTVVLAAGAGERFARDAGLAQLGAEGYAGAALFDSRGAPLGVLVAVSRRPLERPTLWRTALEIFAARAAAEIERARLETELRALAATLERRVAERTASLEAANRELESFTYSVSHDLRAPLRAIAGFAHLLREDFGAAFAGEPGRYLARIEQNALRLGRLLDALLELSRSGRAALHPRPLDMRAMVESVLAELPEAQQAEVVLGPLPPAQADASLVRQVWVNLIANALKFSRGARPPRVEIGGAPAAAGFVEYWVRDNGVGFDMRYSAKLFGVFQRLHSAAEFEGSGAGLAIARRIVERHGGRIGAESAPGSGATFRFTLPAGAGQAA